MELWCGVWGGMRFVDCDAGVGGEGSSGVWVDCGGGVGWGWVRLNSCSK